MGYKEHEMQTVVEALSKDTYITVFYSKPSWTVNGVVKGWKVLFERTPDKPEWVLTYHESLTRLGTHNVEFGKNSQYQRTIKPSGK